MTRNRLYLLLGIGIAAGYAWLAWASYQVKSHNAFTPCVFKNTTGIACPSCGSTRSAITIIHGDFEEALHLNPLGFIILTALAVLPLWLLHDLILNKNTLYSGYKEAESVISKRWVAIMLISLIIINWAWNIKKDI